MNDVKNIEGITARLKELIASTRNTSFEIAELVLTAKLTVFESFPEWIAWGEKELGYRRRMMILSMNAGMFARRVNDMSLSKAERDLSAAHCTNLDKCEILNAIPAGKLVDFASRYAIDKMDREEMRTAVNKYLEKEPKTNQSQPDFFDKLGFPPPDKFQSMLNEEFATVDFDSAAIYGRELMLVALRKQNSVSPESAKALDSVIYDFVMKVSNNDAKTFINRMAHASK